MFAETDQQRKIRLRALELVEDRSEGQRNDFMRAMENAETGLHLEALGQQGGSGTKEKKSKSDPKKDLVRNRAMNWNGMILSLSVISKLTQHEMPIC